MGSGLESCSVKELTTSDMLTGQFSSLSVKSFFYQQVDLRLVCQIETVCQIFSLIQHQKPARDAPLSPPLVACKAGHYSCCLTVFQGRASCCTASQSLSQPHRDSTPSHTGFIQLQSFHCSTWFWVCIQPQGLQYTLWPHSPSTAIFIFKTSYIS